MTDNVTPFRLSDRRARQLMLAFLAYLRQHGKDPRFMTRHEQIDWLHDWSPRDCEMLRQYFSAGGTGGY